MLAQVGRDLLNQWKDRRPATIDETLAADLDDVGFGEDRQRRLQTCLGEQARIAQRPFDEILTLPPSL